MNEDNHRYNCSNNNNDDFIFKKKKKEERMRLRETSPASEMNYCSVRMLHMSGVLYLGGSLLAALGT